MLRIRPAVPDDASAITHVHIESWRTTYRGIMPDAVIDNLDRRREGRLQQWQRSIQNDDIIVLVAELDTNIIGFVAGGNLQEPVPEAEFDIELYTIYLLDDAQGQGIGRQLMQAFAQAACEAGKHSMVLWVLEANAASGFYEHLGGVQVAAGHWQSGDRTLKKVAYAWTGLSALAGKS